MKKKREKKPAVEVLAPETEQSGGDLTKELKRQNAGYRKTIDSLRRQLAEARATRNIRVVWGQEKNGRFAVDEEATEQRAKEITAERRGELQRELAELEEVTK